VAERHSPTSQNPSHLLEIDECGWNVEKKRDNKGQKAKVIANSKKEEGKIPLLFGALSAW
jgi:hypothetical protein